MAAYAGLASLMNNIEQMMKHPHLYNSFDDKQIQSLLEKSGFLLNMIKGNKYGGDSKRAEDFEIQITVAAHAAEDIIETHIVDLIHAGVGSSDGATEDENDLMEAYANITSSSSSSPSSKSSPMVENDLMEAYASITSFIDVIEQMMSYPHISDSFKNKQVQPLLEKFRFLRDIIESRKYGAGIEEVEDLQRQVEEVEDWQRYTAAAADMADAALDIAEYIAGQIHARSSDDATEDVLESHIVDQDHTGSCDEGETSSSCLLNVDEKTTMKKKDKDEVQTCCSFLLHVKNKVQAWVRRRSLGRIIEEMESLIRKANEVMEIKREEHEQPKYSTLPLMESGEPATAMVGLDDELTHLLDELTGHQSNRHTISIVAMGGIGKTTLARNLYANQLIIEHFDVRSWATISQQYDARGILSELLSNLGKSTRGNVGALGEQLYKALIGRRYLIILDDIWSVEAWDKVRHYLPDDGSSSRVLLTTRLSSVACICGSSCFNMNLLDEVDSWKLFCKKTLFPQKDDSAQLENLGKEIVKSCKGLALSIVVIGGLLLNSPRTIGYWESVAGNLKSIPNSKEKQQSLNILSLSYDQLPPHLKPCFLYMGVFKEDSDIRVSTITRLWVAEGFIRPNSTQDLEEIAKGCIKDLIDRNLILVSRHHHNGEIGSLGIHDLLRDLCIKVAEQQEFFHVRKDGDIQTTDRRIVCSQNEDVILSQLSHSMGMRSSFAGFNKSKLMRVLDYAPIQVLYGNVNLRYIAFRDPSVASDTQSTWNLPSAISLVWNLQTLTIVPFSMLGKLVVAPSTVWKMLQLRHIKFSQIYLPHPLLGDGEDVLENLQTLATAVNLTLSVEVCKIIPNVKKLGLLYNRFSQGYDDSFIECLCNLNCLLKLESLKIKFQLISLVCDMHKKLTFPSSLRKLSLRDCQLHWNDLRVIGSLPQLQVLSLGLFSVTEGKQWSPIEGQFCRLKFLKIEACLLYSWDADNSHFPVLEKLVICELKFLEEIPLDIGDIPTLGLIRVERCSLSAAISAVRIHAYQQDLGNDSLQIQIKTSDSEVENFMEMVEAEQLTLNSIQFETY